MWIISKLCALLFLSMLCMAHLQATQPSFKIRNINNFNVYVSPVDLNNYSAPRNFELIRPNQISQNNYYTGVNSTIEVGEQHQNKIIWYPIRLHNLKLPSTGAVFDLLKTDDENLKIDNVVLDEGVYPGILGDPLNFEEILKDIKGTDEFLGWFTLLAPPTNTPVAPPAPCPFNAAQMRDADKGDSKRAAATTATAGSTQSADEEHEAILRDFDPYYSPKK